MKKLVRSGYALCGVLMSMAGLCLVAQVNVAMGYHARAQATQAPALVAVVSRAETALSAPIRAELQPDKKRVSDLLVDAIVQVESAGNPFRVGHAGERGLMQIKRDTWRHVTARFLGRRISFDAAFNPNMNKLIGKAYLHELQAFLQQNRGRWKADERSLLLACYNAGPKRVLRAGFDIRRLPASTRSYVERATALHDYYLAGDAQQVRELLMAQGTAQAGSLPRS